MPGKDGEFQVPAQVSQMMLDDITREKKTQPDCVHAIVAAFGGKKPEPQPDQASIMQKILSKEQELSALQAQPLPEPLKPEKPKFIVGVDFDGTCVTHEFPKVGVDCPHAVIVLNLLIAQGASLVLFTMRSGKHLDAAVQWFADREIPLWGVNVNPQQHTWTSSPKAYCHLYIDDAALGCPLTFDAEVSKRPFVDWVGVDRLLQKHDWYIEPIHQ